MAKDFTRDFKGKSAAQTASIMKAERGGSKREAELAIWPQIEKAKTNEDKLTVIYWTEVILCLLEDTEDPRVPTVDSFKPAGAPQLSLS